MKNWTKLEIILTTTIFAAIPIIWIQPIHPLLKFTLTCIIAGLWFVAKAQTEDNKKLTELITDMNNRENEGKK